MGKKNHIALTGGEASMNDQEYEMAKRISHSKSCSVYRDWHGGHGGGFIAALRGEFDTEAGVHEWIVLGVFASRGEAQKAVATAMGWEA